MSTDLERRLLAMLKRYIDPKYPHFCEVCYAQTEDSPGECTGCEFKERWIEAKALIADAERHINAAPEGGYQPACGPSSPEPPLGGSGESGCRATS